MLNYPIFMMPILCVNVEHRLQAAKKKKDEFYLGRSQSYFQQSTP